MRVAVNLTWLTPGRVGGSEEYLTRQLLGLDPANFDVGLYAEPAFGAAHPELVARFELHPMPAAGNRAARIALEHSWLAAGTRGADVVHHAGGTMPMISGHPTVLTVHDLQYLRHPAYFSSARRRYLAALVPRSVRRANVVTVPSMFVRDHVCEAFGVSDERVVVVPHGVPAVAQPTADQVDAVLAQHDLRGRPYVVYPAITHRHKGHVVLVEMLDHLDDDTALVLIGGAGAAESVLASAILASRHRDRVFRLGRVTAADRDAFIAGADALVFPSEFEGFGAPVIEAMALDTPVVCSSAEALDEVAGNAAVIADGPTGAAWAHAVAVARRRRHELIDLGRDRRTDFTIEASGHAVASAYRLAAA